MDTTGYYYTHQPVLMAAMTVTNGSVLELGSGLGSTLALHGLCGATGRELRTIESDKAWMLRYIDFGREWHQFKHVESFLDLPEYKEPWGLALVDHGVTGDLEASKIRGHSVASLQHVPIVIAHDTCFPHLYNYKETLALYKYRWDWRVHCFESPMTSVLSNTIDVGKVFSGFGL